MCVCACTRVCTCMHACMYNYLYMCVSCPLRLSAGSVLIFVTRKLDSEVIVERLRARDTPGTVQHRVCMLGEKRGEGEERREERGEKREERRGGEERRRERMGEERGKGVRGEGEERGEAGEGKEGRVTSPSLSVISAGLLHGDMDQGERDKVILGFKKGSFPVLVATDVAG